MRDILPYLKCFEVASRYQSFTKAADELCITQSAVSQQMRGLSEQLGITLFRRENNRLFLTFEGKRLAGTVREALASIDNEVVDLLATNVETNLRVCVDPVFASEWLIPKLDGFELKLFDIRIGLTVGVEKYRDFDEENGVDLVIDLESFEYPGVSSVAMARDSIIVVCSPVLLKRRQNIMSFDALGSQIVLGLSDPEQVNHYSMDFNLWKAQVGLHELPDLPTELYPSVELMLQAAVHHRGVALIRNILADDDIRAGRLIDALGLSVPANGRFHISWRDAQPNSNKALDFIRCINEEQI